MHNIIFSELPEKMTPKELSAWVTKEVSHSGDRYGTEKVTVLTNSVLESYDEAYDYICKYDKGYYGGFAVKYKKFSLSETTKSKELRERRKALNEARSEYEKKNSIQNKQAQFIGCSACGSKLSRIKLGSRNCCPVCGADLRCKSVLEKLDNYTVRIKELRKREKEAMKKHPEGVNWLVKWEYHS